MSIKSILKSRKTRDFVRVLVRFLPDRPYLKLYYWATTGRHLDLDNPKGFNEKLNWLKLNYDYSPYTNYCDKIKVHDIIDEKLGEGHMFPILGKWKRFEDIDFDSMPNEFVLKCNHDSGSTKIVRDKSALTEQDIKKLKKYYNKRVNYDSYKAGREPAYKGIDRYIMAEKLMKDESGESASINDYKFFCFNGKPEIMYVTTDRQTDAKFNLFDMDFNPLDVEYVYKRSTKKIEKPKQFEEMKTLAANLSKGIPHVRIDLYEVNGKVYFGEYTFFSSGGFSLFKPDEWERKLGDLIDINK